MEDSRIDEFIVNLLNFRNIAENLLKKEDYQFERFFEKLYNIDKRALSLFIRENIDNIEQQQLDYSKKYFELRGIKLWWLQKILHL